MARTVQVGTKLYSPEVMAMFGAICIAMASLKYVPVTTGGLLLRTALEQLETNLDLDPRGHVNEVEFVIGFVNRFVRNGGDTVGLPGGLRTVFVAFQKA